MPLVMIRNIIILVLSLALLTCVYCSVYRMMTTDAAEVMAADRPELEWLRREYSLSDQQFSEIKARHEQHDVICRELCMGLVDAQKRLEATVVKFPEMGAEVDAALADWEAQRELCRKAALRHMYDVSAVMAPEQAAAYRLRIYSKLIVPGRMPHVGADGEFHEHLIEHAAPGAPIEAVPSADD